MTHTFSPFPLERHGHRPQVIVVAVSEHSGLNDAIELLDALPPLSSPLVVCADDSVAVPLVGGLHSADLRTCESSVPLTEAPMWIAPCAHLVGVRQGSWEVTPNPTLDYPTQVGRLCSSLKDSYRSRVFVAATGPGLKANPFLQLLVQRGGSLVQTGDHPDRTLADRASVADIVAYLDACVGMITKASA